MASRWLPRSEETQVDPFNAGEPELPWEDPAAAPGNEGLFGEKDARAYAAHGEGPLAGQPHKSGDNYQAPTTRGHDYEAPSIEGPAAEKNARPKRRQRRGRAKAPRPGTPPAPRAGAATRRARGCGAVALAIAIVIFVLTTIGVIVGIVEGTSRGFDSFVDVNVEASDSFAEAVDEQEAQEGFEERMGALLDDPAGGELHKRAEDAIEERVRTVFGYSAAELGLDTEAWATWLCDNTRYETDSVFAYDDGTATAYFDLYAPDLVDMVWELDDMTSDYRAGRELWGFETHGVDVPTPTDEDRAHMANALATLLEATEPEDMFRSVDLALDGEEWVVNERSLDSALGSTLGLS